jgi:hypothetical protein
MSSATTRALGRLVAPNCIGESDERKASQDIQAKNGTDRGLTAVLYGRKHHQKADDTAKIFKAEEIELAHLADLPELAKKYHGQTELL